MAKSTPPSDEGALFRESSFELNKQGSGISRFPGIQSKISDLEHINSRYKMLVDTIPDTLLVGDGETLSIFSPPSAGNTGLVQQMLSDREISQQLKAASVYSRKENKLVTKNFCFFNGGKPFILRRE